MRLAMAGINHRTAPLDVRELLASPGPDAVGAAVQRVYEGDARLEAVVLSTCNRTEVYLGHAEPGEKLDPPAVLAALGGGSDDAVAVAVSGATQRHDQASAARHLFRVAAGLDSMVLGEPQVLGQVRRAYQRANEAGRVGPVLHSLFQQAVRAARQVRRDTALDAHQPSVAGMAVGFAEGIYEDLGQKSAVCLGAGDVAKSVLRRLMQAGCHDVHLVNRSAERARGLAESVGLASAGRVHPLERLDAQLLTADLLITSTGATEAVLTAEMARSLMRARRGRPLMVIDLAVPRDVEPSARRIEGLYLYDLDALQEAAVRHSSPEHARAVRQAEDQLDELAAAYSASLSAPAIGPLVRRLRARLARVGEAEQQRTAQRLAAVDASDAAAVQRVMEEHTHRLLNKVMHLPLSRLNPRDGEAPVSYYAQALQLLFDLDGPTADAKPPTLAPPGTRGDVAPAPADEPSRWPKAAQTV